MPQLFSVALVLMWAFLSACSGKYLVKSYPAGAKVFVRDLQTREKKLIGLSPVQIQEQSKLGDVFFLVFEKQNYKPKEVMVRVNEGESLSVSAQLNPLSTEELQEQAAQGQQDDQKPQPSSPQDKKKGLEQEVEDLKLRMALVENTVNFYKDAMFSPRFQGGVAKFDRDRNDNVISYMFQAQQAIARNKLDNATGFIDKALSLDEYVSQAWLLKGSIYYLQRDLSGARSAWERCLKLDPHNKVAYQYLSEVYKRLGVGELPNNPANLRVPASQMEIEKRGSVR